MKLSTPDGGTRFERFAQAVEKLLSVSRKELERRLKAEKKRQPKRKAKAKKKSTTKRKQKI